MLILADFMCTFSLLDADFFNAHGATGMKVKFFKPHEADTPRVKVGDVVVLRGIKVSR